MNWNFVWPDMRTGRLSDWTVLCYKRFFLKDSDSMQYADGIIFDPSLVSTMYEVLLVDDESDVRERFYAKNMNEVESWCDRKLKDTKHDI